MPQTALSQVYALAATTIVPVYNYYCAVTESLRSLVRATCQWYSGSYYKLAAADFCRRKLKNGPGD